MGYGVDVGNAVGLAVCVGMGVTVDVGVDVAGMGVLVGTNVCVNGSTVSVNGSVNNGVMAVNVTPGSGVNVGVRVGWLGTHRISPTTIRSLVLQFTILTVFDVTPYLEPMLKNVSPDLTT